MYSLIVYVLCVFVGKYRIRDVIYDMMYIIFVIFGFYFSVDFFKNFLFLCSIYCIV